MQPITLSQWNSALINAVFLRPDKTHTTLSRIDATGRLLEELSGGQDRLIAKRSFIKAFGSDSVVIKKHFLQSPQISVETNRDGVPPNFAALYLSLLAASADDDTFQVGEFRKRFAVLLGITDLEGFHFNDLPALWKQFALWTKSRAISVGDCAELVLPDPQHERLIGHSKRLAFPTYRDELSLRGVLAENTLDSGDPFHAISQALYKRLGKFSQTFKDELNGFRSLIYAERLQEAYDSPLWGAVRDITLEEEKKELAQFGQLCLQLDTADPLFPEMSILLDEQASKAFVKAQVQRLPRARGQYVAAWAGSSLKVSISALILIAEKDKRFAKSRLGLSLKAGCLPLFPDELGGLSSDGRYFNDGPCCLLIKLAYSQSIKSLANHAGLDFTEMGTEETSWPWTIIYFSGISKLFMERLAGEVPAGARKLFALGWTPPRPRIAGAARYGQSILLTPASNPYVRLEGATSGRYVISNDSGVELAVGNLCSGDEGFYIPPINLVGLKGQTLCRFLLETELNKMGRLLEVPVVDTVPGLPLQTNQSKYEWLVDGRLGMRETISASFLPAAAARPFSDGRSGHMGGLRPLFNHSSADSQGCSLAAIDAIPPALDWLSEALSLRFQTRKALQFADLNEHLHMAGEASNIEVWRLRRALFAGGLLLPIESPLSPHGAIVAGLRTFSWKRQGEHFIVRIRGMFTKQERNALAQELVTGEVCQRIVDPSMPLSIGCIELDLLSESKMHAIASAFQLRELPRQETVLNVLGGVILSKTACTEVAAPAQGSSVLFWDTSTFSWVPEVISRDLLPLGSVLRSEGRQRHMYFVKVGNRYRRTDSQSWAMLINAACNAKGLGTISKSGEVHWAESLRRLPNALCCWWMHFGGGVVGVNNNGSYAFTGGNNLGLWKGIAGTENQPKSKQGSRAGERRTLALSILKKKRMPMLN